MGYKQVKTVAAVFQWHMLLKTDLREDKRMSLLNPSGASDLKYSPSYPSNLHMPTCYTNCFKSKGYLCIHLVLHLTFTFTFTFTHTCYLLPSLSAVLIFPSPSSPLSHSFSHSFSHLSTMSGHVGMRMLQIRCWLHNGWDEPLEPRHSSLIRWHTDDNQKQNSLFLSTSYFLNSTDSFERRGACFMSFESVHFLGNSEDLPLPIN